MPRYNGNTNKKTKKRNRINGIRPEVDIYDEWERYARSLLYSDRINGYQSNSPR